VLAFVPGVAAAAVMAWLTLPLRIPSADRPGDSGARPWRSPKFGISGV